MRVRLVKEYAGEFSRRQFADFPDLLDSARIEDREAVRLKLDGALA